MQIMTMHKSPSEITINVLVIEDDPGISEIISFALEENTDPSSFEFDVDVATDFETGLEKLGVGHYPIVVTDLFFGDSENIAQIDKIRERSPKSKVLAISGGFTGMPPLNALEQACAFGVDSILPKPFSLCDLNSAINRLTGMLG